MSSMRETNLAYRDGEHALHGTWLSVDVIALTEDADQARVVLIEREGTPHRGETTLPGGLLAAWNGETVDQAARRIIREKVGVEITGAIVDLFTVSDRDRDERGHTVSVVVAARVPADTPGAVTAGQIPDQMPFGHTGMALRALRKLNQRMFADPDTTYALLGDTTTAKEAFTLMRACSDLSDTAVRARLERSKLYVSRARETGSATPAGGRPPLLWQRA